VERADRIGDLLREGDTVPDADRITAKDKHVVIIIGRGDTGADCLGTRGAELRARRRSLPDGRLRPAGSRPVVGLTERVM
jgi:NADPH-dependent glutamate synthase beta subunit-like oxidoreductase